MGNPLENFTDPLGILDFAKDQYNANRDYGHTREMFDSSQQFTERMSNTAYRRAVTDMEAAGLNPMLAYQQGSASSPSGGAPTINRASPTSGSLHSAAEVSMLRQQEALVKAQTAKVVAETPGAEATSGRLVQELKELVPVQIRTAQFEQDVRDAAAYFAGLEKNFAMTPRNEQRIYEYVRAKFGLLPVEFKTKIAELAIKQLLAKGARGADEGYESMKRGARYVGDQLGKATNSAVEAYRRGVHGYERFKSNAQYRRKYEFDR